MKYALLLSAALLLGLSQAQPALAQSPADLLKQGIDAQGGADALRAIKGLIQKADVKHWEPGQSQSVNGESRFLGDSTYTLTADTTNRVVRTEWDRDMKFPAAERVKYSEIIYPTYGAVIDEKGTATPMSGIRIAAQNREARRGAPQLLLRALESPQSVSAIADQKLGNQTLPAVQYTDGANKYIILFDRARNLRGSRRRQGSGKAPGNRQCALSMGAAPHLPGPLHRQRRHLLPAERQLQARRTFTQRADGPGRRRQQPDRQPARR